MSLAPGDRLGPYEVHSAIGAGGMGEVWRARDTSLGRDVALKILPDHLVLDPDRLARFKREAQILASLNHPNIAAIYGLERPDGREGPSALVLELVEGPTLADRIEHGPVPVNEALVIAKQIAEALEAAHDQGIVHRDLKPANVKLRPDGTVKVLDFGLAKAVDPVAAGFQAGPGAVSMSPTITSPAATHVGVILGTAAYMSPEQARGKSVDRRSDIWAFGCVLYELLAGKRAFEDVDVSLTLSKVLQREPAFEALPSEVPACVRRTLELCLKKDVKQRAGDIHDVRLALEGAFETSPSPMAASRGRRAERQRASAVAASALLLAGIAAAATWIATRPAPPRVSRLLITPPADAALTVRTTPIRDIAITPDGNTVIYTGPNDTLFVRALDELEATSLSGLGRAVGPFVSPDGQWVAFSRQGDTQGNVLQKAAITGGPAIPLVRLDGAFSGGTWTSDGTIVFATANLETGLQQISADTPEDEPTVLTRPNRAAGEGDHVFPHYLPGGRAVLFTIRATTGDLDDAQIAVLDVRNRTHRTLIRGGTDAQYVASGHLVYGAAGALRAVAFDPNRLEVVGTPVPVVTELITKGSGGVDAAVAADGTLVYAPGSVSIVRRAVVWVDRQGRVEPTNVVAGRHDHLRLSPDGTHVALSTNDENLDIWIWELTRGVRTRLTSDALNERYPVWARDGSRVFFSSGNPGVATPNIFWRTADGTGTVERLTQGGGDKYPTSMSREGALVFQETGGGRSDIFTFTLSDGRVQPVFETPFVERNAEISPDGRWLAYQSNESGEEEIQVRPFPNVQTGRWTVSTAGGTRPVWGRDGEELFYIALSGAVMAVQVERSSTWKAGAPVKLFDWPRPPTEARSYDVASDGRFLALRPASVPGPAAAEESGPAEGPTSLVVVQHFDEELKRLVPTDSR